MVVGGSQQETLDPGFVLLDTCQQGVADSSVHTRNMIQDHKLYGKEIEKKMDLISSICKIPCRSVDENVILFNGVFLQMIFRQISINDDDDDER
ncbi:unnamed protein product [Schistosoma margrebowiei]|uniref:Uncharacterized protein n=1 Tax=Schistosoma margrebowiei TaxID=48269 RepID=A0A183MI48_9TREM|nr:unnamed protein product [Schistosoma margrebowiei]